ncbi:MAG: D-tyrosyl-tRNA(Tyr) deacylase [Clostridia bacterium]|nr:D-tyrosyl-tRNA(Tyr) deacylase [Clostridia bacterium]
MRAVVQRVKSASVSVDGSITGEIGKGLLVLFGAEDGDVQEDMEYVVKKCVDLRIFCDEQDKMNLSVKDIDGEILAVSQFTLLAEIKKGNRPGFTRAMKPDTAEKMYEEFCHRCALATGKETKKGIFGADMKVELINDGPVTIIIDSRNKI